MRTPTAPIHCDENAWRRGRRGVYSPPRWRSGRSLARERMDVAGVLDGWRLAEGWTAGDRFRQQVEHDPTWHDENVFLAVEGDRVIATLTTLPRHLRILGHVVPTGGISNLYTEPGARGARGSRPSCSSTPGAAMRARGARARARLSGRAARDARLLRAARAWFAWGGQQTILRRDPDAQPRDGDGAEEFATLAVSANDERALQSVKSIHAAYAASRSGTIVRDDALWAGDRAAYAVAARGVLDRAAGRSDGRLRPGGDRPTTS